MIRLPILFMFLLMGSLHSWAQKCLQENFVSITYQGVTSGGSIYGVYYLPTENATSLNTELMDCYDLSVMGLNLQRKDFDKVIEFLHSIDTTYSRANLSDHFLIRISVTNKLHKFRLPVTRMQRKLTPLIEYAMNRKEDEWLLNSLNALMKIR